MPRDKKCILVIDDDDNVCQIIKEKFEPLGYQVLSACGGNEGFDKTKQGRPDCVILDIRIPNSEDGLTYLRKLRSYRHDDLQEQTRLRKTPVIILTGAGTAMKSLFELEKIDDFIEKPFDLANLQSKVEKVLRRALGA